jgi:hypothetical protein
VDKTAAEMQIPVVVVGAAACNIGAAVAVAQTNLQASSSSRKQYSIIEKILALEICHKTYFVARGHYVIALLLNAHISSSLSLI